MKNQKRKASTVDLMLLPYMTITAVLLFLLIAIALAARWLLTPKSEYVVKAPDSGVTSAGRTGCLFYRANTIPGYRFEICNVLKAGQFGEVDRQQQIAHSNNSPIIALQMIEGDRWETVLISEEMRQSFLED